MFEICGEFFIFLQGNVPAHRARETIAAVTFRNETPAFISPDLSPLNITDLNVVEYKIRGEMLQSGLASSCR